MIDSKPASTGCTIRLIACPYTPGLETGFLAATRKVLWGHLRIPNVCTGVRQNCICFLIQTPAESTAHLFELGTSNLKLLSSFSRRKAKQRLQVLQFHDAI
jgi:hypothetical protein